MDRLQRRTRQRDQARQELERTKTELAELKRKGAQQQPEVPQGPAGDFAELGNDLNQIERRLQEAQGYVKTANDLLDDLRDDPEGVAQRLQAAGVKLDEYTPAAIRKYLKEVRDQESRVVEAVPRRKEFLQKEAAAINRAREIMPELADPNSDRFKAVSEVIRQYPQLRQRPDWAFHATIYAMGHEAFAKMQGGGAAPAAAAPKPAPKATPPPPKLPGASTAQPASTPTKESRIESLRQKAFAPGATKEDHARWTTALLGEGP